MPCPSFPHYLEDEVTSALSHAPAQTRRKMHPLYSFNFASPSSRVTSNGAAVRQRSGPTRANRNQPLVFPFHSHISFPLAFSTAWQPVLVIRTKVASSGVTKQISKRFLTLRKEVFLLLNFCIILVLGRCGSAMWCLWHSGWFV